MTSSPERQKRLLLILPVTFYSFGAIISSELSRAGYEVVLANDEYPQNMFGRILGKLRIQWLLSKLTFRALYRRFVAGQRYDVVLILKGRGISRRLLDEMHAISPRIIAYNFDSFAYHPAPLSWFDRVTKYCTFDYLDSQRYKLPLVELFSSLPPSSEPKAVQYDVSAIMRNHSERLQYVRDVLRLMPGARTFVYIFEQNIFTLLLNFSKNPILYLHFRKHVHFKSLPYQDYVAVLRSSNFTIDYAHPKQSGTTIRCFEALSAETKIITNNKYVLTDPRFNDANTILHPNGGEASRTRQHIEQIQNQTPSISHRSISDFLNDLLA